MRVFYCEEINKIVLSDHMAESCFTRNPDTDNHLYEYIGEFEDMKTYTFDAIRTEPISKQKYLEPVTFSFDEIISYAPYFEGSVVLVKVRQQYMELPVKDSYKKLSRDLGSIDKFVKTCIT